MAQASKKLQFITLVSMFALMGFEGLVFQLNVVFGLFSNAVLIGFLYTWYKKSAQKKKNFISSTIKQVDDEFKTKFSDKVGFGEGVEIYFDVKNKKFLLIGASDYRVEDFSYIRQWELQWIERIVNGNIRYENVDVVFHTTNFNNPIFRIRCQSKDIGEAWISRLSLIV